MPAVKALLSGRASRVAAKTVKLYIAANTMGNDHLEDLKHTLEHVTRPPSDIYPRSSLIYGSKRVITTHSSPRHAIFLNAATIALFLALYFEERK
ncbi:hypothetical protein EAE99_009132 [Botrytis elliptica]|nr:hypothetical protein EAE99_009132 [Botrytis elliptica]